MPNGVTHVHETLTLILHEAAKHSTDDSQEHMLLTAAQDTQLMPFKMRLAT